MVLEKPEEAVRTLNTANVPLLMFGPDIDRRLSHPQSTSI